MKKLKVFRLNRKSHFKREQDRKQRTVVNRKELRPTKTPSRKRISRRKDLRMRKNNLVNAADPDNTKSERKPSLKMVFFPGSQSC
jgi:hypothetical protein